MLGNFTESLKGTIGGVALLIVSFPVLFKNEGCAVDIAKGLEEGAGIVVSIDAKQDSNQYQGKLIHTIGEAKAGSPTVDSDFSISVPSLGLTREVEMYQWDENVSEDKDKKKTYRYEKKWSSTEIDSSRFDEANTHNNPPFTYTSKTFSPSEVSIGNVKFSDDLINSIPRTEDLQYDANQTNRMSGRAKLADGRIYLGKNPASPEIGDVRIKHKIAPEGIASIIGQLQSGIVGPYKTKRDTTILMFDYGSKDAASMFQEAQDANVTRTWMVRAAGLFLMFLGFRLLFGPIAAAGGWIPILDGILEMGVSIVSGILAFSLSFMTISIAWIFYRPLLGFALLALGVGAFIYLYSQKGKFEKTNPQN
ncbi:hypothetical protein LPTSP4_33800 [Leptospira ryugenii]|uniref:Transmembrane protein 43 n=1 Tax=Leptospira ryugenii TaxID=1917863 RepID=A0A2P2E4Q7_9LEPT|nr:TMEM43 family protein [Leptospira ryugenii]GBF51842.1 hypothetical protein LPTSP4_33800 [Leptospira ryugenii]